ncbi:MAG: GNAT family N-acetyltransferase [Christensenellales bacterium]|jgi:GNAT superfamily N-acetyltransferase|nr:GNAT family N-acetyltransferase [Clostridiales bacterium]
MLEYGRATMQEEAALLDFANMVFSLSHEPTDFRALQPVVYDRPGFSKWTQVARENGRILGMVCTPDKVLKAGEGRLRFGYIGTVSAHPYERGRGIMKELMRRTIDAARDEGLDFLVLGGQRQRYQHFGFEDAGAKLSLYLSQGSISHSRNNKSTGDYRFVDISDAQGDDIQQAFDLHQQGQLVCLRQEADFVPILRNWRGRGILVYEDARLLGYFYLNNNSVDEFAFYPGADIPEMLLAYLQSARSGGVSLSLRPFELKDHPDLFASADSWQLTPPLMVRVFNWQAFLQTLLRFKVSRLPLHGGTRVLDITGEGRFAITVSGSEVRVEATSDPADMTLDPLAAVRLTTLALSSSLYPEQPFFDWFPLPFDIPSADAF